MKMQTIRLESIPGDRFPSGRHTRVFIGANSPIQAANFVSGFVVIEPNGTVPLHEHEQEEVYYILKGTGEMVVGEEREVLETARALIDEEAYEKALTTLDALNEDSAFLTEKEEIKKIAVEKLINRERNRAAKIFLKAKKSDDPKEKEELLNTAYNILKVLVDKYSSSSLIYKVNNNMETVKEALEQLEKNKE